LGLGIYTQLNTRIYTQPNTTSGLDYNTRLENLNMIALEDRIPRCDLIPYYKEYSGTNIINWHIAPATNANNRTTRKSNPH